ncbi:hypothetical protein [Phenylobacterium sp.]|uniref:hypothetical protein n=1 Tax=Phenylobacterium sp. TaxID=1871053 RepID=UPI00271B6E38|nr:hypothetical protein [Phenylobacterium sp.]MDO8802390.1 hypothetical protein [Phenylobacterium sp.]
METRSHRLWAGLTVLTGLVTVAITIAFQMLPEVAAAGACWAPGKVVEFELARTLEQVLKAFGPNACRAPIVTAMDAVNRFDVQAYIPAYTAFEICAAMFLGLSFRRPLVMATIGVALVALAGDYLETLTLLRITQDLDGSTDLLAWSSAGVWIKFAGLALHAFLLSRICMADRRPILAMLLLLPMVGTAFAAIDNSRAALMTYALILSWTPVLLVAARDLVRKST